MTTDVAVDVVVLTLGGEDEARRLHVLVCEPEGLARLPGEGLQDTENLQTAAGRVMGSVGLTAPKHVEQLESFGEPGRVPARRTVSVSYLALVPQPFQPDAGCGWLPALEPGVDLAWDHGRILTTAVRRVRSKLSYSNIAFGLLPDEFTMSQLQDVYEAVLGTSLDKRNFRKKVHALGLVHDTGRKRRGSHRPAALYRFATSELVLFDDVIVSG